MRTPEIDRVRGAHDRMIGIDPNRDARAVTVVTRPQPRACRLFDPPQHHPMFDRCATVIMPRIAKTSRRALLRGHLRCQRHAELMWEHEGS